MNNYEAEREREREDSNVATSMNMQLFHLRVGLFLYGILKQASQELEGPQSIPPLFQW